MKENNLKIELIRGIFPKSILVFNDKKEDIELCKKNFSACPVWDVNMLELFNLKEFKIIYNGFNSLKFSKNFLIDIVDLIEKDWI